MTKFALLIFFIRLPNPKISSIKKYVTLKLPEVLLLSQEPMIEKSEIRLLLEPTDTI